MRPVWIASEPLLLASTSAIRRRMLEDAGLCVETVPPGIDERALESRSFLAPPDLAVHLAAQKALAVSYRYPDSVVLGADQILVCEGRVFHKPGGRPQAKEQLIALAGRTHALHTAGVLVRNGAVIEPCLAEAFLSMRPLAETEIDLYLDRIDPEILTSTGVYRIEGLGLHLFSGLQGDQATILGLPLLPLLAALRRLGLLAF